MSISLESPSVEFLSCHEVAKRLGISVRRVIQIADEGGVAYISTVIGRLYRPADVEALAERRAEAARRNHRIKPPPVTDGAGGHEAA